MRRLVEYDWPGNVRELESCLEGLILFGELDIQTDGPHRNESARLWRSLTESEKRARVKEFLESNGWNVTLTANRLGICRPDSAAIQEETRIHRDGPL